MFEEVLYVSTLTLSDCVQLCQYLSHVDDAPGVDRVDIGLSWPLYSRATSYGMQWAWTTGSCHMVRYSGRTCQLVHLYKECSVERVAEGVGVETQSSTK